MSRGGLVLAAAIVSAVWCGGVSSGAQVFAADPQDSTTEPVILRGRVVCLDTGTASYDDPADDPCNQPGARFELRPATGEAVRFLAGDPKAGIFADPVVRDRELEVHGWQRPEGFEILSVYSIVGGVQHHLHYRCDVCNITTYAPGPCWCCGQPFELREEKVEAGRSPEAASASRADGHTPEAGADAERDPG
jgi:hypothetical protein